MIIEQNLINAKLDTNSISDLANTLGVVETRLGTKIQSIRKILADGSNVVLNIIRYATKANADADSQDNGRICFVSDDTTNNGFYLRTAGSWVKIPLKSIASFLTDDELSDYLEIRETNILEAIDPFDRMGLVPTAHLIAEEGVSLNDWEYSRASSATRINAKGLIETVGSNEIRHQYNPTTGEYEGILIEEASTNNVLRSEDFPNAYWLKLGFLSVLSGFSAPDGSMNAVEIIEDTGLSQRRLRRSNLAVSSSDIVCMTLFFKPSENRKNCALYAATGGSGYLTTFRPHLGTMTNVIVGTASEGESYMEEYPDGWWKLTNKFKLPAAATLLDTMFFFSNGSAGNATYTGDGVSGVQIFGFQIEQLNSPTSYIKTEGTAITRAADILKLEASSYDWINPNYGTLFFRGKRISTKATDYFVSINNGTNENNQVELRGASSLLCRMRAGGSQIYSQTSAFDFLTEFSQAASYQAGRQLASRDNNSYTAGSDANFPEDLTEIQIGHKLSSNYSSLILKEFAYLPFSLNQAQLNQLTS